MRDDADSAITVEDVKLIQQIASNSTSSKGKSVNDLTKDELDILEKVAIKYNSEMTEENRVKSPFFRRWFGDWREFDISPIKIFDIKNKMFDLATDIKTITGIFK